MCTCQLYKFILLFFVLECLWSPHSVGAFCFLTFKNASLFMLNSAAVEFTPALLQQPIYRLFFNFMYEFVGTPAVGVTEQHFGSSFNVQPSTEWIGGRMETFLHPPLLQLSPESKHKLWSNGCRKRHRKERRHANAKQ